MLRSKVGELWRTFVQRRQLVGIDVKGNKYYMCGLSSSPKEVLVLSILCTTSLRFALQLRHPPPRCANTDGSSAHARHHCATQHLDFMVRGQPL